MGNAIEGKMTKLWDTNGFNMAMNGDIVNKPKSSLLAESDLLRQRRMRRRW